MQGRRALYAFCDSHRVPYDRCGQVRGGDQRGRGWRWSSAWPSRGGSTTSRAWPGSPAPRRRGWSRPCSPTPPWSRLQSGVFDSHAYMLALRGEIEDRGGAVALDAPFERAEPLPGGGWRVFAGRGGAGRPRPRASWSPPRGWAPRPWRPGSRASQGAHPGGRLGKGNYFTLRSGRAAVRAADLSRSASGIPGPALPPRPGRPGAVRPRPRIPSTPPTTRCIPTGPSEFYDHVRRYWPGPARRGARAGLRRHPPQDPRPQTSPSPTASHGPGGAWAGGVGGEPCSAIELAAGP